MTKLQSDKSTKPHPGLQAVAQRKAGESRESVKLSDQVVEQSGHDKLFVDGAQPLKRPHVRAKDFVNPMVLHIDDDVDLVDAVTSRLRANGFRVASATDGASGVHSALMFPTNAIILDYDMPNGRGDTVIDMLKANKKTESIPIVVLTAVHEKGLRRQLMNKGADRFMTKPFVYEELQATVTGLIESSNAG